MSDTPRTKEAARVGFMESDMLRSVFVVPLKVAEELERELATRTAERDALKDANACLAGDAVGLRIACAALKAERDEARREACELLARSMKGPMEIAAQRGWDCFDREEVQR
jgi:hypothetical protein